MEIFHGHRSVPKAAETNVAFGNFDGVHIGHRELLRRAQPADAAPPAASARSMAFTFEPHPAAVLAPAFGPKRITSPARRLELIGETGIEACVVEPFTRELAALEPADFFHQVIASALGATKVVVGYDFTFGRQRAGTTETLRELGEATGIEVEVVDPVSVRGIVASSTKVRNFIGEGNLPGARLLLGRNYDIDGVVIEGQKRGRELGYPTANIDSDIEIIAPTGIYAAWVTGLGKTALGDGRIMSATSLGTNPTFDGGGGRTLEPHLLDFDGDLYGARLRVELVEYLRPEERFSSIADLTRAIDRDIANTRRVLAATENEDDEGNGR